MYRPTHSCQINALCNVLLHTVHRNGSLKCLLCDNLVAGIVLGNGVGVTRFSSLYGFEVLQSEFELAQGHVRTCSSVETLQKYVYVILYAHATL